MEAATRARGRRYGKRAAIAVIAAVVALLAMTRAFATFTGPTADTHDTDLGELTITIGGDDPGDDTFDIAATDIVAGDTIMRPFVLTVDEDSSAIESVSLQTTAPTSSILDTDTDAGLSVALYRCSIPLEQMDVGGIPVITGCNGDLDVVISGVPVILGPEELEELDLTPGEPNYLAVLMALSTDADETFIDQESVIRFTFTGTQRAGTFR